MKRSQIFSPSVLTGQEAAFDGMVRTFQGSDFVVHHSEYRSQCWDTGNYYRDVLLYTLGFPSARAVCFETRETDTANRLIFTLSSRFFWSVGKP